MVQRLEKGRECLRHLTDRGLESIWKEYHLSTTYDAELGRLETLVVRNSTWLALGIVVVAFGIRLSYAQLCYLNSDEAVCFNVARLNSWSGAYEASRSMMHPPLFIMVLHAILFFGRTELILRMPSLIGGTAALWLTFLWIRRCLGEIPGLVGLGFMAISPAAISASTEVRQYGILLFFICGSLYATERALSERSTVWAIIQGLFLIAAILTHYITVVVIASLGLYVFARSFSHGVPRRILFTITMSYLVLGVALGWLYLNLVRGSATFDSASTGYLQPYFFAPGRETVLGFVWRALHETFYYVVRIHKSTYFFMLVFLSGIAALLTRPTKAPKFFALMVLSPFVVGFAAAIFRVFPFAGSRHQIYLLPFFAAGGAAAFCWPKRGRSVILLLLAVAVAPFWASRTTLDNDRQAQPKGNMTAAIEYIVRVVPKGARLFVDGETFNLLAYYLAGNDTTLDRWPGPQWNTEQQMGDYRVVVVVPGKESVIHFRDDEALDQVNESARVLEVSPIDPLWVVSVSWFQKSLASRIPTGGDLDAKEFGRISVIKIAPRPLQTF